MLFIRLNYIIKSVIKLIHKKLFSILNFTITTAGLAGGHVLLKHTKKQEPVGSPGSCFFWLKGVFKTLGVLFVKTYYGRFTLHYRFQV